MSGKRIVRHTLETLPPDRKTDWARIDALTDAEIEAAVASDPDAAPLLDAAWFRRAKLVWPERKVPVNMLLDRSIVDWFKRGGRGYQTRINAVLKAYVAGQNEAAARTRGKRGEQRGRKRRVA